MAKINVTYHGETRQVDLFGSSTVLELLNRAFGLELTVGLNTYSVGCQQASPDTVVTESDKEVIAVAKQ